MRPLAEAALSHVKSDGKVHPQITTLQRSGRWSTQDPGLTIWTSRGEGACEKAYFSPNRDNESLLEFDMSQADARIVAAYSGDTEFAKRFEEGVDAHVLTALAVWGEEEVSKDPAGYRQTAKACGHAYAYRGGAGTVSKTAGVAFTVAKKFVEGMQAAYKQVTKWQNYVTSLANRGFVVNDWGRKMIVEEGRSFTQGPALYGQSGTRELFCDGLLRLPNDVIQMVVGQIHDAGVLSVPDDQKDRVVAELKKAFEVHWKPKVGGQSVFFPIGTGPFAKDWEKAGHS